jgi:outer membrane receptor protein involved in Fe transport
VRGTVRDAATGAPVEGAEIAVQSAAERFGARVASDGSFAVERLPAGVVRVIVRRVGYGRDSTSVTLTAGASATVSFRLIRTETRLSEVRVKGEASIVSQQPFTENVIDTRVMKQLHQADSPLKLVEQMPGIDVQNFNQGGLNSPFTIRGFESGGHGGDTYVSLDGILLNDQMYGASDVNMIIPLELDRTTVVKGPASPLYGRFAKGGAFTFTTRKGGTYRDVQAQGGSFGLADIQLAAGRESGAWRANVAGQYHNSDSFRDATFYRKHNVAARIAYAPSERREVSLSARTHRGEWNSAGYLTAAQFNDPSARFRVNDRAAPQDPTDGSSKAFDAIRLDYSQSVGSTARLLVFANGLREEQDLFYSYTTGEEAQATYLTPRRQFAAGASLNGAGTIGARASNWVVGVEFLRERPNELFATGQRRNRFAVYNDRAFDIAYGAAFAQFEMSVHPAFRPSIGVRYDRFGGDLVLRDSFEVSSPITLQMNAYQSVAPKLGLRSTVAEGIELRGSVSNGYDIPTGDLAFRAFGDVNPTQLWQYETGVRFQRQQGLMLDLSAFVLDTDNEITAVANDPPRYENIGSTRRRGVEADLRWFLTPALELRATSSVHRSSVRSSVDTARVGLPVRLVPNGIHTLNLAWSAQNGVGLRLGVRNVGRYWTGEADTFYAGYTAVEGGVQYGRRVRSGGRVTGFIDVRNALDRAYASQASRQFWSPAAPRTIQGGVTWER